MDLRQKDGKCASLTFFAGQNNLTAMRLNDVFNHRQTHTRSPDSMFLRSRSPDELPEDLLLF
jgi:hypothetical protein